MCYSINRQIFGHPPVSLIAVVEEEEEKEEASSPFEGALMSLLLMISPHPFPLPIIQVTL